MKKLNFIFKRFFLILFLFVGLIISNSYALAASEVDLGLNQVEENIVLGDSSPFEIIIKIIQFFLSFLSLVAVVIVLYAGFLWMTSGGSEDKIRDAKKWLKNGLIGLLLVLSSWGIVLFVFNFLIDNTNNNGSEQMVSYKSVSFQNLSLGAIGSCSVESVYPKPAAKDVPKNSALMFTFKEEIQTDSVCINKKTNKACVCNSNNCNYINPLSIQIYRTNDGNSCSIDKCVSNNTNITKVIVSIAKDNKTIILQPEQVLGSNNDLTEYGVKLTSNIKKKGGESMFQSCSSDNFEWSFDVTNKLDLDPPFVVNNSFFPPIDNEADVFEEGSEATSAQAFISINDECLKVKRDVLISYSNNSFFNKVELDEVYDVYVSSRFTLIVNDDKSKVSLYTNDNIIDEQVIKEGKVYFSGYFTISLVDNYEAGSIGDVYITKANKADYLKIGDQQYNFGVINAPEAPNQINGASIFDCDGEYEKDFLLSEIIKTLSGNKDVFVEKGNDYEIILTSKLAGNQGNSLIIESSNQAALETKGFSGGKDKIKGDIKIKGTKDQPMNSVIQVNFNEAISPMTSVGSAAEVSDFLQVVNADSGAKVDGEICEQDSECLSYECQANICKGNYLNGIFSLSSSYKTLEFKSSESCGFNSCGEEMYCLPAGSHLKLKINAASLKTCQTGSGSDLDCNLVSPYSVCGSWQNTKVCMDQNSINYPQANAASLNGIVDLAFNSLDGNNNKNAEGLKTLNASYYSPNNNVKDNGDGFEWSFFVDNEINSTPPRISKINPSNKDTNISSDLPILISFDGLMMNSTLRTGVVNVNDGDSQRISKLINVKNYSNKPVGYWLESSNINKDNTEYTPDATQVLIKHSNFFDSVTYVTQIGSGVKNIYQNCFNPSSGPDCAANSNEPSCCFGTATNSLDNNGNCQ